MRKLQPAIRVIDARVVKPETKKVEPFYLTPEYRAWQAKIISGAGARCEAVDAGVRCSKAKPEHRMFADHIVEIRDGGPPYDIANGQCLCGSHHTLKTTAARAARLRS